MFDMQMLLLLQATSNVQGETMLCTRSDMLRFLRPNLNVVGMMYSSRTCSYSTFSGMREEGVGEYVVVAFFFGKILFNFKLYSSTGV